MSSLVQSTRASARRHPMLLASLGRLLSGRRFPRLDLEAMPADRLRDLGFVDGHAVPRRDPMRD
jgi:hypothetical protein